MCKTHVLPLQSNMLYHLITYLKISTTVPKQFYYPCMYQKKKKIYYPCINPTKLGVYLDVIRCDRMY